MKVLSPLLYTLCLGLAAPTAALAADASDAPAADWPQTLVERLEALDAKSPGTLGVYVKHLADGREMLYAADRPWYLSSTVKVPIAIAVLEAVDDGKLTLDQEITLEANDKIDGAGDVVWQEVGSTHTIDDMLEAMLMQSDNTAANVLIRTLGEDTLNRRARDYMGRRGVNELTTFTQIRRDIYGELHPDAARLTNEQLVEVAGANIGPARVQAFSRIAEIDSDALQAKTMDEAYARYYAKGLNMAKLQAYGDMLEKLVEGDLLSDESQAKLFEYMKLGVETNYRVQAGLPKGTPFIHKTGTQYEQACHAGVIRPEDGGAQAIIVAACAEGLDEAKEAGTLLESVGKQVAETLLPSAS
ncbi:serine hydrolase [Achromobacter sp. GG226]|uniref:serine hydrolase n=1 Tax=Verticiella alkaliphila TaxID=2779529 RepID=UPI001C0C2D2A|nr:serine hydrolase [Verticiella sp. GG226]MBU4609790.1 serine hydrolase [Verticiella sp. GG226]